MADLVELEDRLDALWAEYLPKLDQYQVAQAAIIKNLSNGFFSLTQANYKSTGGRRYGRDYYDERMKASRRCEIKSGNGVINIYSQLAGTKMPNENGAAETPVKESDTKIPADVAPSTPPESPSLTQESTIKEKETETAASYLKPPSSGIVEDAQQQPTPAITPPPQETGSDSEDTKEEDTKTKPPSDPLHWFGILVPKDLRSAQSSFSAVLDEHAATAVNSSRSMRDLEVEIRKLRKAIKKAEKATAT